MTLSLGSSGMGRPLACPRRMGAVLTVDGTPLQSLAAICRKNDRNTEMICHGWRQISGWAASLEQ